jgi:predicted signal transduction protein with EAL and GGDEF domain
MTFFPSWKTRLNLSGIDRVRFSRLPLEKVWNMLSPLASAQLLVAVIASGLSLILLRTKYKKTLASLKKRIDELEKQLLTDDTTGVYSSRILPDLIRKSVDAAQLSGQPLSIILLDIDGFGRINREYSYDEGDVVLRKVAQMIAGSIEATDYLIFRYNTVMNF